MEKLDQMKTLKLHENEVARGKSELLNYARIIFMSFSMIIKSVIADENRSQKLAVRLPKISIVLPEAPTVRQGFVR